MNTLIALDEKQVDDIADRLAQASNQVLELRVRLNNALTSVPRQVPPQVLQDLQDLRQIEIHLDQMVAFFRAQGIYMINQGAQQAVANVNAAIEHGKQTVADIHDTKAAIKAAAGLLDLAGALLSRNPLAVVEAANHLRAQPGAA